MLQQRTVYYEDREIHYQLELKPVKNVNIRIHKDSRVYVSANPGVPVESVDAFVASKGRYICTAQDRFRMLAQYAPRPKQYVSGESFYLLGRGVRLAVEKDTHEAIFCDGVFLFLHTKDPDCFEKKKKMVSNYLTQQCQTVFEEIVSQIYPVFQKYGVSRPSIRIRNMETRWGSCLAKKGMITLNKRLLEAPRSCIEYVIMHEFCHFIHPDHSKNFYTFLTMLMPDWKERKEALDRCATFGL